MYQLLHRVIHSGVMCSLGRALPGLLWSAFFAALAAALAIGITRFAPSSRRYNLLMIIFAGFVLTVPLTIICSSGLQTDIVFHLNPQLFGRNIYFERTAGFSKTCEDFLNKHSGLTGSVWVLVSAVLFVRTAVRFASIRRFKAISSDKPLTQWHKTMTVLSASLDLKKVPAIFASHRIDIPMLIGHSDPAIFLPIGLPEKLSGAEIKEIILHELAHAKRRDYLINLGQTMVEILLWFNPAVWWISRLLRMERENCCDDLVVKCTDKPVDYVRSLIKFEEFRHNQYAGAMTLTGRSGSTVKRISRIISGRNAGLGTCSAVALSGLILAAGFYIVTTSYNTTSPDQTLSPGFQLESAMKHRAEAAELLRRGQ